MRADDQPSASLSQTLTVNGQTYHYSSLREALKDYCAPQVLPYSTRARLEQLLSKDRSGELFHTVMHILSQGTGPSASVVPDRLLLQTSTDIAALSSFAWLRSQNRHSNTLLHPALAVDLIVDHAAPDARQSSEAQGITQFSHWCQSAFRNFRLTLPDREGCYPPAQQRQDIIVGVNEQDDALWLHSETIASSSPHSQQAGALGIAQWPVSSIETESLLSGIPLTLQFPTVIGLELEGQIPPGCTAVDAGRYIANALHAQSTRQVCFEFTGTGLHSLTLRDRLQILQTLQQQMDASFYFPLDNQTLRGLTMAGQSPRQRNLIEHWAKTQHLLCDPTQRMPVFSQQITINLHQIPATPAAVKQTSRHTHRVRWPDIQHPQTEQWPWQSDSTHIQPPHQPEQITASLTALRILARLDDNLCNRSLQSFYENALSVTNPAIETIVFGENSYGSQRNDQTARVMQQLGIQAVVCKRFCPMARRSLIMAGILPLTFTEGDSWQALRLNGHETVALELTDPDDLLPGETVMMTVVRENNRKELVELTLQLQTEAEIQVYQAGGSLNASLKRFAQKKTSGIPFFR